MKILIFGSTGFVGRSLTQTFAENKNECRGVSFSGSGNSISLDISDANDFDKLTFKPDVIINCASKIPDGSSSDNVDYIKKLFLTNVLGGVNIANWAVKNEIPRIVNCSTLVVIKKPWPDNFTEEYESIPDGFHTGYCMSKLSQERLMSEVTKKSHTKLLHIRLSSVYGKDMVRSGIIFALIDKLNKNEDVHLVNAESTSIDFIHVQELSRIISYLSEMDFDNGILNVASGNPILIIDLVLLLKKLTNSKSVILNEEKPSASSFSNISVDKLKKLIGERALHKVSLEDGLKQLF